jgi:hypothetical protein
MREHAELYHGLGTMVKEGGVPANFRLLHSNSVNFLPIPI